MIQFLMKIFGKDNMIKEKLCPQILIIFYQNQNILLKELLVNKKSIIFTLTSLYFCMF